jgi:replicative DNA helicase
MTEPQNVAHYNIEVEQALLGAVLISGGSALDLVDGIIAPDDFSEGLHARLFEQFIAARNRGRSIDVALARAALGSLSDIQVGLGVNVPVYIARLAAAACSVINSNDYAMTIRECADRRRMVSVTQLINDGCAAAISPAELATAAIDELDAIALAQPGKRKTQFSIVAAADQAVDRMQWGMQNPGKLSGISWGLSDLDAKTGGLQRGELIVMAGRPGMGKSGLMISCVRQSAKAGSNALIFSHEMTAQAVADRALADSCFEDGPVAYHDIARGHISRRSRSCWLPASSRDCRSRLTNSRR